MTILSLRASVSELTWKASLSQGMVMNMHSLLASKKDLSPLELENHFDGNICRCTGYRPILASFKKLLQEGWRLR